MKKREKGFAATGILYTILIIFLLLMSTLLVTFSARSKVLNKLKDNAKEISGDDKYVKNFAYTGSYQTWVAPYTGEYRLQVWGAQGGYRSNSSYGGKGGYSVGNIYLTKGTTLYIYVGGSGNTGTTSSGSILKGGFNGGGYRYGYPGGGGATDIRISSTSLKARVIVAGGGGSDGASNKKGMYGGGTSGGSSTESYTQLTDYCGKGGTARYSGYSSSYTISSQTTTGLNSNTAANYQGGFGFGGGGVFLNSGYGGAGGGGWYGGSGTVPDSGGDDDRGGGGGSGYVYTVSTAYQYPSGCLLNPDYYLKSATTYSGNQSFESTSGGTETGHEGNGYARISFYVSQDTYEGIPKNSYAQGETVMYLGYKWKVMKDNGTSDVLVLDSYLSSDDLKSNLPSNIDSSEIADDGMPMCTWATSNKGYCNYEANNFLEYSWNKSLIKPVVEKWLESQMKKNELTKTNELISMTFTDSTGTNYSGYVRLPIYSEISSMNGTCSDGSPYCASTSHYMFGTRSYWTLTAVSDTSVYGFLKYKDGGGVLRRYINAKDAVRPVITVKERTV